MYMAQRPVVHLRFEKIVHSTGGIGFMTGIRSDIGMEKSDMEKRRGASEQKGKIPSLIPYGVADALNRCDRLSGRI